MVKVHGFSNVLRLLRALHTYDHCQSALDGLFDKFSYDSVAWLVEHCVDTFVFDLSLVFYAVIQYVSRVSWWLSGSLSMCCVGWSQKQLILLHWS